MSLIGLSLGESDQAVSFGAPSSAGQRQRREVFQAIGQKGFERHGGSPVVERAVTLGRRLPQGNLIVGMQGIGSVYAALQHD
jgi:hypothetical protein